MAASPAEQCAAIEAALPGWTARFISESRTYCACSPGFKKDGISVHGANVTQVVERTRQLVRWWRLANQALQDQSNG